MCADLEQHWIKVFHHGRLAPQDEESSESPLLLLRCLEQNITHTWVPMVQWLGPVVWGLRSALVLPELTYQKSWAPNQSLQELSFEIISIIWRWILWKIRCISKRVPRVFQFFTLIYLNFTKSNLPDHNLAQFAICDGHCCHWREDVVNRNSWDTPRQERWAPMIRNEETNFFLVAGFKQHAVSRM